MDGLRVGVRRQVSAEGYGVLIGIRVDHGRQLVADAVSSYRGHGVVSGRPGRCRQWTWGWSTALVTGGSPAAGFQGRSGRIIDAR